MVRFSDIFKKHLKQSDKTSSVLFPSAKAPKVTLNKPEQQVSSRVKRSVLIKLPPRVSGAIRPPQDTVKSFEIAVVEEKEKLSIEATEPKIFSMPSSGISLPETVKPEESTLAEGSPEKKSVSDLDLAEAIKIQQVEDLQKADQLYQAMSSLMEKILTEIDNASPFQEVSINNIISLVEEVVTLVIRGDRSLLDLVYRYSSKNYLISHMVNVCILSIELSKALGYNKSKLEELGLAALLHDIGMQQLVPLVGRNVALSPTERESISNHILQGKDILEGVEGMLNLAKVVCQQHHERISGKGYQGIVKNQIHEAAQIVGLADVFEAMTHPRPHRKKKVAQEVLKELLEGMPGDFDKNLLRVLVKRIGIYPAGSWVELNTGEIGRVARVNERFLLRPIIQIIFNSQHQKTAPIKTFDLAKHPNIFIKSFVDESDLKIETNNESKE